MKVSNILATKGANVITVRPDQTIREVVQVLVQHNIGAVVVMDEAGQLAGIISERDIVRRAAQDETLFDQPAREIMTRNVVTAMPQDDVMSVAHTMTERRFRHIPIISAGQLLGIISIGDVLKLQRDMYRGEIDTLETQLMAGNQ